MPGNLLPDEVEYKSSNGHSVVFVKTELKKELCGLSLKDIYRPKISDADSREIYFGKVRKEREKAEIFSHSVSSEILVSEEYRAALEKHQSQLAESDAFREILTPLIASAIFNGSRDSIIEEEKKDTIPFLIVPYNIFLRCPRDVKSGEPESKTFPLVLSKGIDGFDEFLSRAIQVKDKRKPADHTCLIKKEDLLLLCHESGLPPVHLSLDQAVVLGKLYFIGLLMGHWDILNNINLSNAGSVTDKNGNLIPVIVDWGNTFPSGFKGVSQDQTSFKNPDFPYAKDEVNGRGIEGFEHAVPFDGVVYPILPRQLVSNLLEMSGEDPISTAVLEGFVMAYQEARKSYGNLEALIGEAITDALFNHTNVADASYVSTELLTSSFYFPEIGQRSDYTIVQVMRERIDSLGEMIAQLKSGVSLQEIAKVRFDQISASQMTPHERRAKVLTNTLVSEVGIFKDKKDEVSLSIVDEFKQAAVKKA
jgi:hypothetical protein